MNQLRRLNLPDRRVHGVRIEEVAFVPDDRAAPRKSNGTCPCQGMHFVSRLNQQRRDLSADEARGAGQQNSLAAFPVFGMAMPLTHGRSAFSQAIRPATITGPSNSRAGVYTE